MDEQLAADPEMMALLLAEMQRKQDEARRPALMSSHAPAINDQLLRRAIPPAPSHAPAPRVTAMDPLSKAQGIRPAASAAGDMMERAFAGAQGAIPIPSLPLEPSPSPNRPVGISPQEREQATTAGELVAASLPILGGAKALSAGRALSEVSPLTGAAHAVPPDPVWGMKGDELRPAALQKLGPAKWKRGQVGRYDSAVLTGADADHVMNAIENVAKRFPSLRKALPEMARALQGMPDPAGTLAAGVMREPESGLIIPTPSGIARWARFGRYGEEIPANWGPLTQPGMHGAFGQDPRDLKLYADLWGAISPLNDPMTNTMQANRAFGRTLGPAGLSEMEVPEFNELGLGLPSRRDNINRSMAGEPLSGPKVPRMSGMIEGTERLPPFDEHVTTATGGVSGKWDTELPALRKRVEELTGNEYKGPKGKLRLNKDVSEGLVAMWDAMYPERDPLTSMASGWEGVRSDKGIKSVGGPYDILRRLGLSGKDAMLNPKIGEAKWPGGYISSSVLLPLLLEQWNKVTNAQPENAASPSDGRQQ